MFVCHRFRFIAVAALSIMFSTIAGQTAQAAPPDVVTSIKPVQALVKMVMGNLATPDVIMPPSASPHVFTMKPSQAKMLEEADVVFWIGPQLETTLSGPLENVAGKAMVVELLKTPGLDLIEYEHTDEHGHGTDEHGHGNLDPHIWLSPSNAKIMIDAIAAALIRIDPNNDTDYAMHAQKAKKRIDILIAQTQRFTEGMRTAPYLVQHDGFAYLAREFGLNQVGFVQTQPGREPGAKHVSTLLQQIQQDGVKCLFHEAQYSPKLAQRLKAEANVGLREIDPMGMHLTMTETTYVRLIQAILINMESCLSPHNSGKVEYDTDRIEQ